MSTGYRSNFKRAMVAPAQSLSGPTPIEENAVITPALSEECRARCENNTACVAYTYIRPFFGGEGECSLYPRQTTGAFNQVNPGYGGDSGYKALLW